MKATNKRSSAGRTALELNVEEVNIQLQEVIRCERVLKKRADAIKLDTSEGRSRVQK